MAEIADLRLVLAAGATPGPRNSARLWVVRTCTRSVAAVASGSLAASIMLWTITGAERDKSVFRVPSLRNVEVTAPYFHDGRTKSLPEAVIIMARSQLGRELPATEVSSIVAFLKTLTGYYNGQRLTASPTQERP